MRDSALGMVLSPCPIVHRREEGLLQPPIVDADNPLVLFRLSYVTRLFPICTDIVTPPILMVVFIIVALIDRFTTERTSPLRLLRHLHPLNPR